MRKKERKLRKDEESGGTLLTLALRIATTNLHLLSPGITIPF